MNILIVSHGELCKGILDSYKMIAGENLEITAIPFYGNVSSFRENIENFFNSITSEKGVVFCDILGGTPYNEIYTYIEKKDVNYNIVCGYNLGMIIEVGLNLANSNITLEELTQIAEKSDKESVYIEEFDTELIKDDLIF